MLITGGGSPLEGEGVLRTVAQERSAAHTASHRCAKLRLAQIACVLGPPGWQAELAQVPGAVEAAIALRGQVAAALAGIQLGATL